MTYARLAYRPGNVAELHCLLRYLKNQEIKETYARNTMSMILRAACPNLKRELYSEFVNGMDKQRQDDSRTGNEIVDNLVKKLKKRREKRKWKG